MLIRKYLKKEDITKITEIKVCPDCGFKVNPLRSGGIEFYCLNCQHDSITTTNHKFASSYFPEHNPVGKSWNNKGGKPNIPLRRSNAGNKR